MKLSFIPKSDSCRSDDVAVEQLAEFILENKCFLGITLSILGQWKKPITNNKIENTVKNDSRFDNDIKKHENYNKFIMFITCFYDGEDSQIDYRRGRLLEVVWESTGTYNDVEMCKKVEEAHVLHEGEKISERDIDIIYFNENEIEKKENEFIELHECKSSAKNTLRSPLKESNREKLELMENTVAIADTECVKCNAYIITFELNSNKARRMLRRYNFNSIEIICRDVIEQKVCLK